MGVISVRDVPYPTKGWADWGWPDCAFSWHGVFICLSRIKSLVMFPSSMVSIMCSSWMFSCLEAAEFLTLLCSFENVRFIGHDDSYTGTLHLLLGDKKRRQWVMSMRILDHHESQNLQGVARLLLRYNKRIEYMRSTVWALNLDSYRYNQ